MNVYLAFEDSGTYVHATALGILRERADAGYWYEPDEAAQARAEKIVAEGNEQEAWRFLNERSDYEYERVERQPVLL